MAAEPSLPRAVGLGVPLPSPSIRGELFELVMLGGPVERRYRRLRPDVEGLPWGTLDPTKHSPELLYRARRAWTEAAFQEHRTGVACSATLKALMAARAPVDLIALGSRFPLDEMAHVEMCARLATELGAAEINALGWMEGEAYLKLAHASLRSKVIEPLVRRGIRPG